MATQGDEVLEILLKELLDKIANLEQSNNEQLPDSVKELREAVESLKLEVQRNKDLVDKLRDSTQSNRDNTTDTSRDVSVLAEKVEGVLRRLGNVEKDMDKLTQESEETDDKKTKVVEQTGMLVIGAVVSYICSQFLK